jgi:hypothetical protein
MSGSKRSNLTFAQSHDAEGAITESRDEAGSARVMVFSGKEAVLAQAELLEALADSTGQSGAMHGLHFVLNEKRNARKIPHLICVLAEGSDSPSSGLLGAAVVFEYGLGPFRTGYFATGDPFGAGTIVAPENLRTAVATKVCSTLLERGGRMVLTSFRKNDSELAWPPEAVAMTGQQRSWGMQTRVVQDCLPLGESFDATLARMGKRTRNHMRYYRRKFEQSVAYEFVADAIPAMRVDDRAFLKQLNRGSLDPVMQASFDLQMRSTVLLRGGFVSGLRGEDGRWLALAGGWRQNDTTWVQWQMNVAGYEKLSLSMVLRTFLIEEEIARGRRMLCFHGGTSHSMSHSFVMQDVVDLVGMRPGVIASLMVKSMPRLFELFPRLATRGNILADALSSRKLRWTNSLQ